MERDPAAGHRGGNAAAGPEYVQGRETIISNGRIASERDHRRAPLGRGSKPRGPVARCAGCGVRRHRHEPSLHIEGVHEHVPPMLVHHVERSRSLHETVILLTVEEASTPVVPETSRCRVEVLSKGFYKLVIAFGYMEEPLLLPVLRAVSEIGAIPFDVEDAT